MRRVFSWAAGLALLTLLVTAPPGPAQEEPSPPPPPSFPEAPPNDHERSAVAADTPKAVPAAQKTTPKPPATLRRRQPVPSSAPPQSAAPPPTEAPVPNIPAPSTGGAGLVPIDPLVLPSAEPSLLMPPWWPVALIAAGILLALLLLLSSLWPRRLRRAVRTTGPRRGRGSRRPTLTVTAAAVVLALLAAGLALGRASAALADVVTTFAGGGPGAAPYAGDGGQASEARLWMPGAVAVAPNGDVFIADTFNHRVRRVSPTGVITTFAGTGTRGAVDKREPGLNIGDGGPAALADLNRPTGVAVAANGDVFIADTDNNRIRRVDASGKIATVVGSTDFETEPVDDVDRVATQMSLRYPVGVVVRSDVLFVTDDYYHAVYKVRLAAPPGTANASRFAGGVRLPTCGSGGQISCTDGIAGYSGDGFQARDARLNYPRGLALDPAGNLFIADSANNRVRKVDTAGIITSVAGTGAPTYGGDEGLATLASLSGPVGVAVVTTDGASDRLVISDSANHRIREVGPDGRITTIVGDGTEGFAGDGGAGPSAKLRWPAGVGAAGTKLFLADSGNDRVRLLAPPTPPVVTVPVAPTAVAAAAGDASASLSWTAPASDGGSPVTSYTVTPYVDTTAQPATTVNGNPPPTGATVSGLTNGTTYTFTVTATNSVGSGPASAPSNSVTPGVPAATVPESPTDVTAVAGDASATVRWAAPASDGGSPVTSYTVTPYVGTRPQQETTVTGTPPPTAASINGLTNGTTYTFRLKATNEAGSSVASGPSNEVTPTAPPVDMPASDDSPSGEARPPASVDASQPNCAPLGSARPNQVAYPAGFSLIGLPGGTRVPSSTKLWGWFDQGRGSHYSAGDPDLPLTAGRGYWKYFACPTEVDLGPETGSVTSALGPYHASMIGNPSVGPVTVSGHDYASRWVPASGGGGSYRLSGFREPQRLAPGEGIWVFAYRSTTIRVSDEH